MSHLAMQETEPTATTAAICPRCGQPIVGGPMPLLGCSLEANLMKLTEFYDAVARRADMAKIEVGAADTRRVLSEAFAVLAKMSAQDVLNTVAQGVNKAKAKRGDA